MGLFRTLKEIFIESDDERDDRLTDKYCKQRKRDIARIKNKRSSVRDTLKKFDVNPD